MQVLTDDRAAFLRGHFGANPARAALFGYGTVRDYCESVDAVPELAVDRGDLKEQQRPWALKTILSLAPAGAHVVEIGAAKPTVAQALVELGYRVTVVDPYDGSAGGPTAFADFVDGYPEITFLRAPFGPGVLDLTAERPAAIYSVSLFDKLPEPALQAVFAGIAEALPAGGFSIHCLDYIARGAGARFNHELVDLVAAEQARLHGFPPVRGAAAYLRTVRELLDDVDTYYLSAAGYNVWRARRPYDDFPYRPVASFTSVARRSA